MASSNQPKKTRLGYLPCKGFRLLWFVVAFLGFRYFYYRNINSSLVSAVDSGDVKGVQRALEWGANPNEIEYDQGAGFWDIHVFRPVLLRATFDKNEQIVRLLLEAGADVCTEGMIGDNALDYVREPDFTIPPKIKHLVLEYAKKQGKLH